MNAAISLKAAREMLAVHAPGIVRRKAEGRAIAWEELARMAGAADKWNAAARDFRPLKAESV